MAIQKNVDNQYGIKYRVIPLDKKQIILYPVSLVKGFETEDGFEVEGGTLPFSYDPDLSRYKYVVDMVLDKSELEFLYQYISDGSENDLEVEEFLAECFYDDFKDSIIYIDTDLSNGYVSRNEINLKTIRENHSELAYVLDHALPSVVLNEAAVKELSESTDIHQVQLLLRRYREQLQNFRDYNKNRGVTRINVLDGKIESVETKQSVEKEVIDTYMPDYEKDVQISSHGVIDTSSLGVSFKGLRDYIKERVFGHEEEIDTFAQKLYMNYTAEDGEAVESILLVGPTGVGKTETVNAACEYLNIPYYKVNAANLVPQGIKGMSIEDVIVGLFENAGHDELKAQRGLVFLDEFDKLNDSDMEIKNSVKNILLTFTAGGSFPIDNDRYTFHFDSSMTNKVYAGVFEKILSEDSTPIGFMQEEKKADTLSSEEVMRQKIIEKGYFSLEELTRISSLLGFSELDRDTKKRIILYSKLSELLKKKERYKRQFGVDLVADDTYIEAILDSLSKSATGMRSVNNLIKRTMNPAERALLEADRGKQLVLTNKTVNNPYDFDLC